jgi:mono/diheme cytochrome c family protein
VFVAAIASLSAQGGPYQRQRIDPAAAARGRMVYAQHCINCHGSTVKGTERGPDLIRSPIVLRDRLGNTIGPAIAVSATHQARLTPGRLLDVAHFLHQRVESIASNRSPTAPLNVLTGDPEEGLRYFNGAGKCSGCHSPTGDLSGIATRIADPVNLQQRFLFPTLPRNGRRQVEVIVSTTSGQIVTGNLVRMDDFSVALRDAAGEYRSFARGPGISVAIRDPLATHHALLDLYTDEDMHNLTAYLATLK